MSCTWQVELIYNTGSQSQLFEGHLSVVHVSVKLFRKHTMYTLVKNIIVDITTYMIWIIVWIKCYRIQCSGMVAILVGRHLVWKNRHIGRKRKDHNLFRKPKCRHLGRKWKDRHDGRSTAILAPIKGLVCAYYTTLIF